MRTVLTVLLILFAPAVTASELRTVASPLGYRDRLHDPHSIDIDRCLVFRRDRHRYSSLARVPVLRLSRASVATCWKNCLIGSAGEPQTS